MDPQEQKIWQTAKSQGKDDAFIKGAILAYRARKTPSVPVQSDKGFLGNIVASATKPFARGATNLINVGQILTGQEETKPLSGSFWGDVKPVGQEGTTAQKMADATGWGLELASNIPLAGAAKLGTQGVLGGIKSGGYKAAKEFALPLIKEGAFGGGLSSAGSSMQEGKSAQETALNTALGAGVGAVAAPVIGAAISGAGGVLGKYTNAGKLFKGGEIKPKAPDIDELARYVTAPLDKTQKKALKSKLAPSGYESFFGKKVYEIQEDAKLMAQAVKDLIIPKKKYLDKNIDIVTKSAMDTYNNDLLPFLRENPAQFDPMDLNNYLNTRMKPSDALNPKSDSFYAFNKIKNNALKIINSMGDYTTEGVQKARTQIDNMINETWGDAVWDKSFAEHTGAKEGAMKVRNALNDFTADLIKLQSNPLNMERFNIAEDFINEAQKRGMKFDDIQAVKDAVFQRFGGDVLPENELKAILFRNKLKNISLKIKAAQNMWETGKSEIGKTRFGNLPPTARWAAYYAGGGALTALGLNRLFSGSSQNTN